MSGDGGPVRPEDAFDVVRVAAWLASEVPGLDGVPEVRQFSGGASNLTFLLRYPARDVVLRRPPSGTKARGAHDMRREHVVLERLRPVFGYVPQVLAFCDDPAVIGADFYVMERLAGLVPSRELGVEVTPEQARALCEHLLDVLVELHEVDPVAAGLDTLGKGEGYVRRQVEGWSRRYRDARTDDAPSFEPVMEWLDAHQPPDVGSCVVHNDFKLDNLVLAADDPTRVVGVLDWEMATVGDPLMELGGTLAYWVQADDDEAMERFRRVPSHLPGMMTRAEVVAGYAARRGLSLTPEDWRFYETFGFFRLAVIAQQIYYRYALGQTTNEVYARFGPAVHLMDRRCRALVG